MLDLWDYTFLILSWHLLHAQIVLCVPLLWQLWFESKPLFEGCGGWEHKLIWLQYVNLCHISPKNSHGVCRGCAGTLTFNEGYICGRSSWGVHSPIFCCEGNIHGHTLWVCIHPYSVVKATSVAVYCGCALTHTLMKAVVYSLPCAAKASMMSVCNRVSVCVMFV